MKIIIYGIGQIGNVVSQILKESGHEIIGYVDDNTSLHSKSFDGIKIFGGFDWLLDNKIYDRVCLGVGTILSRKKILTLLLKNKIETISAIHPSVIISSNATLGKSLTIGANSTIYGNIRIGDGSFIGPSVTVSHDTMLGKFNLISVGSVIGARVVIEDEVFVGSGSVLTPKRLNLESKLIVGKKSIIGAGSVVIENIKAGNKVAGVPAKPIS